MGDDLGRVPTAPGSQGSAPQPPSASSPVGADPSRGEFGGRITLANGEHVRLSSEEAERLWNEAEADKAKRAADMPTEQDAINAIWSGYQRLRELGWNNAIYCPKDGSEFDAIEAGSTGIHKTHYSGEWPNGSWWVADNDGLWPSRPILYRPTEAELAKREEMRRRFRELRDSDGSPKGGDGEAGSVRSTTARPEGIAQKDQPHD